MNFELLSWLFDYSIESTLYVLILEQRLIINSIQLVIISELFIFIGNFMAYINYRLLNALVYYPVILKLPLSS